MLNIEATIKQLVTHSEEPFCAYLYDLGELRSHAQKMISALPKNAEFFYAAKANPEREILAALSPIVDGFEAASGGELKWLHQLHPEKPLIFGGPGKLPSELKLALECGVDAIHVESQNELKRLAELSAQMGRPAPVFLRMNIPLDNIEVTKLAMGGKPTPFGFDPQELPDALAIVQRSNYLELKGFHFHLMSHQLCVDTHLKLIQLYFNTFKQWCTDYQLSPPILNVGGGMGINYQDPGNHFDWWRFCEGLKVLIDAESMNDTRIRFECGRFVTATCGYYVMEVLDIKRNHGEFFAIARGGTHHFRTPAAQGHSHPFSVIKGGNSEVSVENEKITIVGQLCTPKDVLAKSEMVKSLSLGDYLCFPLAGAYAWNISHQNFLMHEKPRVYFL
ncbi:type III PLP-dependent enzyme [Microbulbifer epialgicus]|uniref:Type III PLP-dependent enzyme n=1 Tax=Microbulbifer epialgicus TaxID=393907 RepID=A0ABV4P2D8_9GAMM